jgi:asparagine synthase (glutamine-hydrolysing)
MCGFVGTIQFGNKPSLRRHLRNAMTVMTHRGPDDECHSEISLPSPCGVNSESGQTGVTAAVTVLLGHRRLSIIDLSEAARQPMSSPDGRLHLVFNGEIYNYRELRPELARRGWRFRTESDTEVLLAGYQIWGRDLLMRLVGMFSFAVVDIAERTVFLGRDPFGIKPCYYTQRGDSFFFASEIKALLEFPGVGRAVNVHRLAEFMCNGHSDHGGETFFADVRQVPSAHYMVVPCDSPGEATPVRYWAPQVRIAANPIEMFRELFAESVELHLRSDVPVGISLSGGIDSSAIAGMLPGNGNGRRYDAISYIADDPEISEQRWCDVVARMANMRNHAVHIGANEMVRDFDRLVRVQEHPFGSPTIYAQYRVFQAARENGLKVMLSGQGADQYLGSYHPHLPVRFASLVRQGHWIQAVQLLQRASAMPAGNCFTLRSGIRQLAPNTIARLAGRRRRLESLPLNMSWFRDRGVEPNRTLHSGNYRTVHDVLHETLESTHLPTLLRIEDRNAMAFSIENRVPFLTTALVEFAFSLPEQEFIGRDGTCKLILMRAMEGIVPREVLARRDKIGFCMPMQKLIREVEPWASRVLKDAELVPALDAVKLAPQADSSLRKGCPSRLEQPLIWRWISLIAWAREYQVRFY